VNQAENLTITLTVVVVVVVVVPVVVVEFVVVVGVVAVLNYAKYFCRKAAINLMLINMIVL